MQDGKEITLNVQRAGDIQKYLVGKYDLEVLTLPRIYMNDVTISQSTNTYIDILGAGQLTYRSSNPIVGQIFIADDRGQNDWVCDIDPAKLSANIYLQPGLYKIVYRLKSAVSTDYTTIKEFRIVSGDSVTLNL
jgi:Ca-activated chloride channel family protein